MRSILAATAALFLMANPGTAPAAESSMLAIKAGFLLGHAQSCGVAPARIERLSRVIRRAIAADARDTDEKQAAGSRFDLVFVASAHPDRRINGLVVSCRAVVAQFDRLERHQRAIGMD